MSGQNRPKGYFLCVTFVQFVSKAQPFSQHDWMAMDQALRHSERCEESQIETMLTDSLFCKGLKFLRAAWFRVPGCDRLSSRQY